MLDRLVMTLTASNRTNWVCTCVPPAYDFAVAQAATCIVNECHEHEKDCHQVGQICVDPNTSPTSLNDWECECVPPAINAGTSNVGGPAMCDYPGECPMHEATCLSAGQTCDDLDPTPSSTGDWVCECVPPATGFPTNTHNLPE